MTDARQSYDIVPSDTVDISPQVSKIWVGGAGNISFVLAKDGDTEIVTVAVVVGQILEGLRIRRVMATGTTATLLKGLY